MKVYVVIHTDDGAGDGCGRFVTFNKATARKVKAHLDRKDREIDASWAKARDGESVGIHGETSGAVLSEIEVPKRMTPRERLLWAMCRLCDGATSDESVYLG